MLDNDNYIRFIAHIMTRKRSTRSTRRRAAPSRLRRIKYALYGLIIGLVGLSGASYIPDSLIADAPPEVQQAIQIATDLRRWLFESDNGDLPVPVATGELPRTAASWHLARRTLYERVHFDQRETLYCGCDYNADKQVSLASCGLDHLTGNTRAERVEAEHVFPASQFGNFRQCWREPSQFPECTTSGGNLLSGRDCCQRVDETFVAAHNDLHNLYPSVGYINGRRSNYNWGMISTGNTYGSCDILIDSSIRRVQPPEHARGFIARAMFYMRDIYGFNLSRADEQLYAAWNNQYPPDDWEIERNQRITAIQGVSNPYVQNYRRL